jgi:hypothetical protein
VVLDREYLHLSRALFAASGSFSSLYEDTPKALMARDLAFSMVRLPLTMSEDVLHRQVARWRKRLARLPLPKAVKERLDPPRPQAKPIGRPAPKPIVIPPAVERL